MLFFIFGAAAGGGEPITQLQLSAVQEVSAIAAAKLEMLRDITTIFGISKGYSVQSSNELELRQNQGNFVKQFIIKYSPEENQARFLENLGAGIEMFKEIVRCYYNEYNSITLMADRILIENCRTSEDWDLFVLCVHFNYAEEIYSRMCWPLGDENILIFNNHLKEVFGTEIFEIINSKVRLLSSPMFLDLLSAIKLRRSRLGCEFMFEMGLFSVQETLNFVEKTVSQEFGCTISERGKSRIRGFNFSSFTEYTKVLNDLHTCYGESLFCTEVALVDMYERVFSPQLRELEQLKQKMLTSLRSIEAKPIIPQKGSKKPTSKYRPHAQQALPVAVIAATVATPLGAVMTIDSKSEGGGQPGEDASDKGEAIEQSLIPEGEEDFHLEEHHCNGVAAAAVEAPLNDGLKELIRCFDTLDYREMLRSVSGIFEGSIVKITAQGHLIRIPARIEGMMPHYAIKENDKFEYLATHIPHGRTLEIGWPAWKINLKRALQNAGWWR